MKQNWKRFVALFLAVAMILASGVIATNTVFRATDQNGDEVHHHSDACYETQETTSLTCTIAEHTHSEGCPHDEEGNLTCTQEEHSHGDGCYTTTTEDVLICGYTEGQVISSGDSETEEEDKDGEEEEDYDIENITLSLDANGAPGLTQSSITAEAKKDKESGEVKEIVVRGLPDLGTWEIEPEEPADEEVEPSIGVFMGWSVDANDTSAPMAYSDEDEFIIPEEWTDKTTLYAVWTEQDGIATQSDDGETMEFTLNANDAPAGILTQETVEGVLTEEGDYEITDLPSLDSWEDVNPRYMSDMISGQAYATPRRTVEFAGWATKPDELLENARPDVVYANPGDELYAVWRVTVYIDLEEWYTDGDFGDLTRIGDDAFSYEMARGSTLSVRFPGFNMEMFDSADFQLGWYKTPLGDRGNIEMVHGGGMATLNGADFGYAVVVQVPAYQVVFDANTQSGTKYPASATPKNITRIIAGNESTAGSTMIIEFPSDEMTREFYEFYEWNGRRDDRGTKYKAGDLLKLNVNAKPEDEGVIRAYVTTVYAQWIPHTLLEFDGNGDNVLNVPSLIDQKGEFDTGSNTVTFGNIDISELPEPTREGYIFLGWKTADGVDVKDEYEPESAMLNDEIKKAVLYAQWSKITDIVVKAGDGNHVYDGTSHEGDAVDISFIIGGQSIGYTKSGNTYTLDNGLVIESNISASVTGEAKNVGTYETKATVSGWKVMEGGEDKTAFYKNAGTEDGVYTVTKKPITMKSASAEKSYDGKALTADMDATEFVTEAAVKAELAAGDEIKYTVTGKQITPGDSKNTFTYEFTKGLESNYEITKEEGTLKVKPTSDKIYTITIDGKNVVKTYDGEKEVVDEYTINGAEVKENIFGIISGIFDGNDHPQFTITDESGKPETYTIEVEVTKAEGTNVGNYDEIISGVTIKKGGKDVTGMFDVTTNHGSLTINKAPVTLTAPSAEKEYDGQELTETDVTKIVASGDNADLFEKNGRDKYDYVLSGSQTEIGTSDNKLAQPTAKGNEDNFDITVAPGTLTVKGDTQYDVTITAKSDTFEYDGTDKTVTGYTLKNADGSESVSQIDPDSGEHYIIYKGKNDSGKEMTFKITGLKAQRTEKNASANPYEVTFGDSTYTIEGADAQSKIGVTLKTGTLTITPKAAKITSPDDSKDYDGDPLVNKNVILEGFVDADKANIVVDVTGSQTEVGSSTNTIAGWSAENGTLISNYTISKEEGLLTVKNRSAKYEVELVGKSLEIEYDGTLKEVSGFTVNEVNGLGYPVVADNGKTYYVQNVSSAASGTDVKDSANTTITDNRRIVDGSGKDVSEQFNLTITPGKLTINPREVTVKSATLSKDYDGKPISNKWHEDGTIEDHPLEIVSGSFVNGQGVTAEFDAEITIPGSVENTYSNLKGNTGTDLNNYIIKPEVGQLTVNPLTERKEITLNAESYEGTYDGQMHKAEGFKEEKVGDGYKVEVGGVEYIVTGATSFEEGKNVVDSKSEIGYNTGSAVVTDMAGKDVTSQFTIKVNPGKFEIKPAAVTLQTFDASKVYDGTPLTNPEFKAEGFVDGEGVTATVTGTVTRPGPAVDNTFSYDWNVGTDKNNYTVTEIKGKLIVTDREAKYEITLTANSYEGPYDGQEHTAEFFNGADKEPKKGYEYDINGQKFYVTGVTSKATGKDVKDRVPVIDVDQTNLKVEDSDGEDVTSQFNVAINKGSLNITKATVTLQTFDGEKEYDGDPLTNEKFEQSGFAKGEGVTATVTGSRTNVGTSENTFTHTYNEGTNPDNYEESIILGTLTVKPRGTKYDIELNANSKSQVYNGEELVAEGFKETKGEYGYAVTAGGKTYYVSGVTSRGTATNVSESHEIIPVMDEGGYVVRDASGEVVTDQFNLTVNRGSVTIEKCPVTLTSGSAKREYNGAPLTSNEFDQDNFVSGEGVVPNITGQRTLPGISDNTYTYTYNSNTKEDNYTVTEVVGKLEIINRNAKYDVELKANSGYKTYDGKEFTVKGLEGLDEEPKDGYEITVDDNKYYVKGITSEATGKDVSDSKEITPDYGNYKVYDSEGNDVTDQFNVTVKPGRIDILPADVILTAPSASKEYDGTALTANDPKDVTIAGDGADIFSKEFKDYQYEINGSQTIAGESANTLKKPVLDGKEKNYNITVVPGTLVVTGETEYSVVITANSGSKEYDATALDVKGYTLINSDKSVSNNNENEILFTYVNKEGKSVIFTITGYSANASRTDAGEEVVELVGNPVVTDASGNDVTSIFSITPVNGKLSISQRPVTLTSGSDEKEYDGQPLTNDEFKAEGFLGTDGVTPNITGTITTVGTKANEFTYTPNNGTNIDNYKVTKVEGTLKITDRSKKYEITLHGNDGSKPYDGTPLEVDGFKEPNVPGHGYEVTTPDGNKYYVTHVENKGEATNVSDSGDTKPNTEGYIVKDVNGNDVTDQFSIDAEPGKISITPAKAVVWSQDNEKVYDGTPLTNGGKELKFSGFAPNEGVSTEEFNASITAQGETPNTYGKLIPFENTILENYTIERNTGTLKVTPVGENDRFELTLYANSEDAEYDGQPHTAEGFKETYVDGKGYATEYNGLTFYVDNVTSKKTGTNVSDSGVVPYVTEGYVVKDASGKDVTENFTVSVVPGNLNITKKEAKLTSQILSKPFDGTELTNGDTPLLKEGFVGNDGDSIAAEFTKSILNPGQIANEFTYSAPEIISNNYEIGTDFGTLTITPLGNPIPLVLHAASDKKTYDGTPLKVEGFTETYVEGLGYEVTTEDGTKFYVENVTSYKEGKDVSESGDVIPNTEGYVVKNSQGQDVTENFFVTAESGKLTIEPAKLHLKSASAEREYNGSALTAPSMEIDTGWVNGEGATYNYSGSQTYVGTSWNNYSIIPNENTEMSNYELTKEFGVLKVTDYGTEPNDPANPEEPKDDGKNPYASVSKYSKEGVTYNEGDTIKFNIEAKNIYATAMDVTFEEKEGVFFDEAMTQTTAKVEGVASGTTATVTAYHKVTKDDIEGDTGNYYNKVIARFTKASGPVTPDEPGNPEEGTPENPDDGTPENPEEGTPENPDDGTPENPDNPEQGTPEGSTNPGDSPDKQPPADPPEDPDNGGTYEDDDEVPVFIEAPSLFVEKKANFDGVEGLVKIGDKVTYTIKVTNNGNVTLTDVKVVDDLTGDKWTIDVLEIGDENAWEGTTEYEITAEDVINGSVKNVATATAKDPRDDNAKNKDEDGNPIDEITDDDDEIVTVDKNFKLTIKYVDEAGNPVAPEYSEVTVAGTEYRVDSPTVSGYTLVVPEHSLLAGIMPAQDITIEVPYKKVSSYNPPATPDEPEPEDPTPAPEDPTEPEGDPEVDPNPEDNTEVDEPENPTPEETTEPTAPGTPTGATATPGATPVPPTPGTIVTVDNNGNVTLTPVEDIETALANQDLGHICNILYFLILLTTSIVLYNYYRSAKKHNERIFELRSELGEDDPYRKEKE